MPDKPTVLVIGATGVLGRPVTRELVGAGLDVRVLARDPRRARALLPVECHVVPGNLRNRASLDQAIADVDAVYLSLSNAMTRSRPRWDADVEGTLAVIDAAKAAGGPRLLRLSALGVGGRPTGWWVADVKTRIDEAVRESGLPYTIYRPTWFMESIAISAIGPLLLCLPGPTAPIRWLAAEDYGRQVAAAILEGTGIDRTYDVHGPEGVSIKAAFQRFAKVWCGYLVPVPIPRPLLAAGARMTGAAAYLNSLIDFTNGHVVTAPATRNGHPGPPATTTIEQYAERLRKSRDFPSKSIR